VNALFDRHPRLAAALPRVDLALLPTPVRPLAELGRVLGGADFWLKDDALSGALYGGNKVRKLEFLLGRAVADGRRKVMTFGYAGSNHAAATAVYAARHGLRCISMFLPQETAPYARRNLLAGLGAGAELHEAPTEARLALLSLFCLARHGLADGRLPMVIPAGGSSPLGVVGFVAAGFELAADIERGRLPRPRAVHVAAGTLGTAVGLAIGLRAAGSPLRVVATRVTALRNANERKAATLFRRTVALLHGADPTFPALDPRPEDLELRHDQFGPGYALPTDACRRAVALAVEHEELRLDPTYTGKAMASMIADTEGKKARGPVLFWNTFNGRDIEPLAADLSAVPAAFRSYFEVAAATDL
jgi:1-aminocyclopropane-1-carboxylate deaminase/D-cysteine desulfhydrase-like pyridoxal-dependent ACC family enzyme